MQGSANSVTIHYAYFNMLLFLDVNIYLLDV